MDVRDESSSMPPPYSRGSGTQIDWPSRAGCHTWIPDAIGYNTESSSQFGHHENNRDQHGHHGVAHHLDNDHSHTYSRVDISPINSMDMDFSHSSLQGRQRTSGSNGRGSHASSSLMNVFEKKSDPSQEGLNPQIHRPEPSWERSYRSRSPVSIGDTSSGNGTENSLIRVNSHRVKDKLFGIVGKSTTVPSGHEGRHQSRHQNHHPPSPIGLSAIHGNQHGHQNHQPQQNFNGSRDVDMDWD